ncbi:uncharacterized protein [Clytia hemisphaerica]|uniref:Uncharacterized protein n=1 Tax=Clytia hemisphaerica TaxID=252671 RepID=A0A7M5UKZ1_9CNID
MGALLSSKYVKKSDYQAHLVQIQGLLEDLQLVQSSLANKTKENGDNFQQFVEELRENHSTHRKKILSAEEKIITLTEKVKKVNELDTVKTDLQQVTLEHHEDRTKLSSYLKTFVESEKRKWNDDLIDLKSRIEGIHKYTGELVDLDLQHEREIKELRNMIKHLESKLVEQQNQASAYPDPACADKPSAAVALSSPSLPVTSSILKPSKFQVTPVAKDSAFISQQPSLLLNSASSRSHRSHSVLLNQPSVLLNSICSHECTCSPPTQHENFSKISLKMKELRRNINQEELKKKASFKLM